MLKLAILLLFAAMLISLLAAAGFLVSDGSRSQRVLTSLTWRVCIAVVLLTLLLYGFYSGQLPD
ncbi:DUF2909 domain-containing protein [Thalassolituus alkanivorans]|uniref:DUF2909 domain-containing protein n=1 Tax=Thalassolituus alkanivorans TaxID=2881055 RepID=UPI001E4B0B41|nr:DUF2909 domain-containing protein [Thalassolituus alkanivorans]MCB2388699.1 DUF2909 domain-containing protein [Thalassolituus alkanivorans]MCB2424779.1 DUF2909 domain-containing protein [Thalassolituus alkanivorans]